MRARGSDSQRVYVSLGIFAMLRIRRVLEIRNLLLVLTRLRISRTRRTPRWFDTQPP